MGEETLHCDESGFVKKSSQPDISKGNIYVYVVFVRRGTTRHQALAGCKLCELVGGVINRWPIDEVPGLGDYYTTMSKWVRISSTAMKVGSSKNRRNRLGGGYLQRRHMHLCRICAKRHFQTLRMIARVWCHDDPLRSVQTSR